MGGVLSRHEKQSGYSQVILLGAENAGKSTILKQMQLYHGNGFTQRELNRYKHAIFANVFNTFQHILFLLESENVNVELDYSVNKVFMERIKMAPPCDYEAEELPFRLEIMMLWKEVKFRAAVCPVFRDDVFFELMDRITSHDFEPTTDEENQVRFIDVGGTVEDRTRWQKFIKASDAIVWVVDALEYDTPRLADAVRIFAETMNEPELTEKPVLLVLSKDDLLGEKLLQVNKHVSFPEFRGNLTGTKAKERKRYLFSSFVFAKFMDAYKSPQLHAKFYPCHNSLAIHSSVKASLLKALAEQRNKVVFEKGSPSASPLKGPATPDRTIKEGKERDEKDKGEEKKKNNDYTGKSEDKRNEEGMVMNKEIDTLIVLAGINEPDTNESEKKKKMKEDPEQVTRLIEKNVELKERPKENNENGGSSTMRGDEEKTNAKNNNNDDRMKDREGEIELSDDTALEGTQMETERPKEKKVNKHEGSTTTQEIEKVEGQEEEAKEKQQRQSLLEPWVPMEEDIHQAKANALKIKSESKREMSMLDSRVYQAIWEVEQQEIIREDKEGKEDEEDLQISHETSSTNFTITLRDVGVGEDDQKDKDEVDNSTKYNETVQQHSNSNISNGNANESKKKKKKRSKNKKNRNTIKK